MDKHQVCSVNVAESITLPGLKRMLVGQVMLQQCHRGFPRDLCRT